MGRRLLVLLLLLAGLSLIGIGSIAILPLVLLHVIYLARARFAPGLPRDPNSKVWLGSLVTFRRDELLNTWLRITRTLGERCWTTSLPFLWFADLQTMVFLGPDPCDVKHILQTNVHEFVKGGVFHKLFHDLLGSGIFNSDGDRWKFQRKLASHLFTHRMMETKMLSVFRKNSSKLCDMLAQYKSLDIQDFFFRLTFDSFIEIAFSQSFNSLQQLERPEFLMVFDRAQLAIARRAFDPIWSLKRALNLGAERQLKCDVRYLRKLFRTVLDMKRVAAGQADMDLLDRLLISPEMISDEFIVDFMSVLINYQSYISCAASILSSLGETLPLAHYPGVHGSSAVHHHSRSGCTMSAPLPNLLL